MLYFCIDKKNSSLVILKIKKAQLTHKKDE